MKAYDYVEKLINECEHDPQEFGNRLKNSLVRLTKRYNNIEQEEIVTKSMKRDIFAYVFVPEIPREHAITITESIQCGLALQSQPPTIDDLPKDTYAGYILVQNNSTLYFINRLDQNDKVKSFLLNKLELSTLISELKISNNSQIIPLLSCVQSNLITRITKHSPIISRLSSTYSEEWLALTPSQVNTVIQNPGKKITISLGERYGAIDIDCFWVVEKEANDLVASINETQEESIVYPPNHLTNISSSNKPVFKEEMYNYMALSSEERQGLIRILQNKSADERNQFIKETADSHMETLKKKFPRNKLLTGV